MAVLLLLPSAEVRGRAAPPCPGRQGRDVTKCPQEPRFREPCSVLTSGTGGPGALSPLSYPICPADLPSLSGLPKSFPHENWGTEGHSHHPSLKFLLFSISLLGKPPHSSIMSMATGKNLQSIPKKVSNVEPCEPGLFLRNVSMEGAEPWGREGGGRNSIGTSPDQGGGVVQSWERSLLLIPRACPLTEDPVESMRQRGGCHRSDGPPLPADPALLPALLLAQVQPHHQLMPHLLWLHTAELLRQLPGP